jgi:hypothetical protein
VTDPGIGSGRHGLVRVDGDGHHRIQSSHRAQTSSVHRLVGQQQIVTETPGT